MRRLLCAILAPVLFAAPAFATEDHPLLAEGAALYGDFCAQCHGAGLKNPVGKAYDLGRYNPTGAEAFKRLVLAGKGDMPAWAEVLTGAEIDRIWVYVATRAGAEAFPAGADAAFGPKERYLPDAATAAAPAWDGDPKDHPQFSEGKSLYSQMCSHCHGLNMVSAGTASYDLRKYPRDRAGEFRQTVQKGKGDMPAWGDILSVEEIDALWVYISTRGGKEAFPGDAGAARKSAAPGQGELVADGTLRVCLARNGGAMSGRRSTGGTGLDYAIALGVAERLGLDLEVKWFEAEQDELQDPVPEAYAMLALDLCDLVPAHPLMPGTTGAPPRARAAAPLFPVKNPITDMPQRPPHVDLRPAEATIPYMRTQLALVVAPGIDPASVRSLADLTGLRVGIEQGTVAEAILRRQAPSGALDKAATFNPGATFLWQMEKGQFDVALVDVAAFDFHRRQNRITKLRLTPYRHAFSVNIAMLGLAERADLIATVSATIATMLDDGAIRSIAEAEKVHWVKPRAASSSVASILSPGN